MRWIVVRTPWCSSGFNRSILWLAALLWLGQGDAVWADTPAQDLKAGNTAYQQYCARCHGVNATGDGIDAKRFYPRPRNLTLGVYKFRTTASGTPPMDEDLFRTITRGLPGTNMPDWQHLDDATRWQLVYYLKSLSPTFQQTPPTPVKFADEPSAAHDLAKGKALYQQLGCAACHGVSGRANGTSAAGLVDDWGMPIRPANLTQGWAYRGGNDPRSIMQRVMTGIDGAGMPSYAETLSPVDAWQLAYYVASLQEPAHWNMTAHPFVISGALPTSLDDPRWSQAEQTDVRVRNAVIPSTGEWAHPPTIRALSFRAITNGQDIVFQIMWDDPVQNTQAPADALALVMKPAGIQGDVVTLQAWPYAGSPTLDVCYWTADASQAIEALANDYDSVRTHHVQASTPLASVADYHDGRWQVLVTRALQPTNPPGAATSTSDIFGALAFAIWDGSNPDARAVSTWVDLSLQQLKTHRTKH